MRNTIAKTSNEISVASLACLKCFLCDYKHRCLNFHTVKICRSTERKTWKLIHVEYYKQLKTNKTEHHQMALLYVCLTGSYLLFGIK